MPLVPSPKLAVSYFDDLDYFKDFEKEFPAIVYNDAQTSKLNFLTEPTLSPQHIDEFNLKDETSLSECDEEEQNVLKFNDLFPFNVVYPDDLKLDKDNDDDKIDIEHSLGDLSVKPLPDVINTDVGAYAHGLNKLLETRANVKNKKNPIERNHTEVFPKDLSGLPPTRIVKYRTDLVPGAAPVDKAPYCLSPSEMQELSKKQHELLSKRFIRPSSSPLGALVPFYQKEGRINTHVVCRPYLDKFVIVLIDDIPIYSRIKEEHEQHLYHFEVSQGRGMEELQITDKLQFMEEPLEIMDREVKRLKHIFLQPMACKGIASVFKSPCGVGKVMFLSGGNSKRGDNERDDEQG
ncbi:hypothetical protein Tco_1081588, partial [Tanacetum coccineum]